MHVAGDAAWLRHPVQRVRLLHCEQGSNSAHGDRTASGQCPVCHLGLWCHCLVQRQMPPTMLLQQSEGFWRRGPLGNAFCNAEYQLMQQRSQGFGSDAGVQMRALVQQQDIPGCDMEHLGVLFLCGKICNSSRMPCAHSAVKVLPVRHLSLCRCAAAHSGLECRPQQMSS